VGVDKVVYTGGTFDLFHIGHVRLLQRCAELGRVVVALNPDEFNEQYKGVRPVMCYEEREEVLRACKYVWDVLKQQDGHDSRPTVLRVMPNVVATTTEWTLERYAQQTSLTEEWLNTLGIQLVFLPYTQGISTTELKRRMCV